jgi:alcohol dehydrogenase class IV
VCDPELTFGCPPALTASAGADALSHVVESFTAVRQPATSELATERVFVGKNELTDTFALLGVRLIAGSLQRAWSNPEDVGAREAMMLGATAGGFALGSAGTAAAHAIQYPVGAVTHTPHGVGVGVLLPYVMEFNRPARIPELAAIALAMGAPPDSTPEDLADEAIDRVATLLASVGIPSTLADLGLPPDQLRWTAEQASGAERLVANNPRPLDVDTLEHIVRAAHAGDRAALREARPEPSSPDLTSTAGAR